MAFGNNDPGREPFDDFLFTTYNDPHAGNKHAVAHNFLIDANVAPSRQQSYRIVGAMKHHANFDDFNYFHTLYLENFVFQMQPDESIEYFDRHSNKYPETFKPERALRDFGGAASELLLIRMDTISQVAELSANRYDEVKHAATAYLADPESTEKQENFAAILEHWNRNRDLRPLWAGFWEDMNDLVTETGNQNNATWADELRNRLGLYHLDPNARGQQHIEVLVFCYPVSLIPRIRTRLDDRALAIPSVLDNRLSEVFFPAPHEQPLGYSVYLGESRPYRSYREIVHFHVHFKPEHLWRVGKIAQTVPSEITPLHDQHLFWLQAKTGSTDYGKV